MLSSGFEHEVVPTKGDYSGADPGGAGGTS